MKQLLKLWILSVIGGFIYILIELMYRGFSHWSMFLLGGLCFISIGLINELFTWKTPFYLQSFIGGVIVTLLEFIVGCIVNIWLKWDVWDYSNMPLNLCGQICLIYFGVWICISARAIILDDWLRHWLFGEKKPNYILF